MPFPTIPTVGAGRVLSVLATNPAGTHTSPNLSSLTKNSGDLLIAIVIIYDGNSTNAEFSSWGGGFTEFGDFAGTATMGIGCAYKWSTGSETGTFTVTSADASSNDSAFFLLSIQDAHASTPPEIGGFATGTSTAADTGSLNPAGWGQEKTLWIAVGGSGETGTGGVYGGITAAPPTFSDYAQSGISADAVGGVEGAVAFVQSESTAYDASSWTLDLSNARNSTAIIAVRPRPDVLPDQLTFRGRNDDNDESTATWKAAAGTNFMVHPGEIFRVRFVVQASDAYLTSGIVLERNLNGTGWETIPTAGAGDKALVTGISSAFVADGTNTTDQLGGTGTFFGDQMFTSTSETTQQVNIVTSGHAEIEWALDWLTGTVGSTAQLRLANIGSYTAIPTITLGGAFPFHISPYVQLLPH